MATTNHTEFLNLPQGVTGDTASFVDIFQGFKLVDDYLKTYTPKDATDSIKGIITTTKIQQIATSLLQSLGLGASLSDSTTNINDNLSNRLLITKQENSMIDNKDTAIINFQYENYEKGVQIGITNEIRPRLYVRTKNGASFGDWVQFATKTDVLNTLKVYGIGSTDTSSNLDINGSFGGGLYSTQHSSKINGVTTNVINFQYGGTSWGNQLAMTEEDSPKLYLRAKRNNSWTTWLKVPTEDRVQEMINETIQVATFEEVWGV